MGNKTAPELVEPELLPLVIRRTRRRAAAGLPRRPSRRPVARDGSALSETFLRVLVRGLTSREPAIRVQTLTRLPVNDSRSVEAVIQTYVRAAPNAQDGTKAKEARTALRWLHEWRDGHQELVPRDKPRENACWWDLSELPVPYLDKSPPEKRPLALCDGELTHPGDLPEPVPSSVARLPPFSTSGANPLNSTHHARA